MKYLKNFRGYSLNELSSGETGQALSDDSYGEAPLVQSPYAQQTKSTNLIDDFESEFPHLINQVKKILGNKFSEFITALEKTSDILAKISPEDKLNFQDDISTFFGSGLSNQQLESEVKDFLEEEIEERGILESEDLQNDIQDILKKIMPSLVNVNINESVLSVLLRFSICFTAIIGLGIGLQTLAISAPIAIFSALVLFLIIGARTPERKAVAVKHRDNRTVFYDYDTEEEKQEIIRRFQKYKK